MNPAPPATSQISVLLSDLKTRCYRGPRDELQRLRRWGPRAYFRLPKWQNEMAAAAQKLPGPFIPKKASPVELWFLTGHRFWYQTAFCAWTFSHQAQRPVILNLVDDGTLSLEVGNSLRRIFPSGLTLRKEDVASQLDNRLPPEEFPMLRQRWTDYINIRKLTDIHLGGTGRKLVLDSDMLFFDRPDEILEWYDGKEDTSLLMTDCEESYGYSRSLMTELAGAEIPPRLNVGVCGLHSEELDWRELEHWSRTLFEQEGTSYYLEQALVAMIAARRSPVVLDPDRYITYPSQEQTHRGHGVMQHYVADSKPWYFGHAWRLASES